MKDLNHIPEVGWLKNNPLNRYGMRCGIIKLPTGIQASVVAGSNEAGWEHVSIELKARRLPTWDEMCYVKDLFWDEEEEVVQMHPRKSEYVNLTDALHLWRPVGGDWSKMNNKGELFGGRD